MDENPFPPIKLNLTNLSKKRGASGQSEDEESKVNVSEELAHLRKLLAKYQKNLQRTEQKIASHGGEMNASDELMNQKEDYEEEIDKIETQIEELEKTD
ncbi:MAG TPA: hypothetical protein VGD99_10110 [Anaerolineae bacterium]